MFTLAPSELVRRGLAIEEAHEGGERGRAAASALGVSPGHYYRAKAVIRAAEENPDRYADLVEEMDRTRAVAPVYHEMLRRRGAVPAWKRGPLSVRRQSHPSRSGRLPAAESDDYDGTERAFVPPTVADIEAWARILGYELRPKVRHRLPAIRVKTAGTDPEPVPDDEPEPCGCLLAEEHLQCPARERERGGN